MTDSTTAVQMALFALATSATPGPVNVLSAMSGARFGVWRSMPYVLGASASFVTVLIILGLGFRAISGLIGRSSLAFTLVGASYMLYLAWQIAIDNGKLSFEETQSSCPGFFAGLVTQALNPKAWIVSISAITIYVSPHHDYSARLVMFSAIFCFICAASLTTWVAIGAQFARFNGNVALFNRVMAGVLAFSVIGIVIKELSLR